MAKLTPLVVNWRMTAVDSEYEALHHGDSVDVEFVAHRISSITPLSLLPVRIHLKFHGVVHYWIRRPFGDDEAVTLHSYDRRFQWYGASRDEDMRLNEKWLSTGICCDPFAYEVVDSQLMNQFESNDRKWKEYLFAGEDLALSVVASQLQILGSK